MKEFRIHTYIVQFIYENGNGWAIINCASPYYIEGTLRNQSRYRNAKITSYKELAYFGDSPQLVYEGSVTTFGESSYDIAVRNGFIGTEQEYLESLHGKDATVNGHSILIIEGGDNVTIEQNGNILKINASTGANDYVELKHKPSLNSVTLEGDKSAMDLGLATSAQGRKADSAYQKPQSGIPSTDLAEGVIPSVPAISTDIDSDASSDIKTVSPKAVKTFVENKGYGTYSKPSGGIPGSDLASGVIPTVPTISTDVATDKASDAKTASPKAVYDEVHPAIGSSQPSGGMLPNVIYNLGTLTETVTFSMASASDSTIANHWYWTFDTDTTAPTITWPATITSWYGGSAPTINASKHYEISVLNGIGIAMEV